MNISKKRINKLEFLINIIHSINIQYKDRDCISSMVIDKATKILKTPSNMSSGLYDEYKNIKLSDIEMVIEKAISTNVLLVSYDYLGQLYYANSKYTDVSFADILESNNNGIPLDVVLRYKKIKRLLKKI